LVGNNFGFETKQFSTGAAKDFAIGEQQQLELTVFVRPRSESFCNTAKNFGIGKRKQLRLTVFVQPRSETFYNWRTKATQIAVFVLSRREKL
jgi:hypothetical protein